VDAAMTVSPSLRSGRLADDSCVLYMRVERVLAQHKVMQLNSDEGQCINQNA